MKLLFVLLTCIVAGSYGLLLAMNQTQLIALEHALVANAQCSATCNGDFPTTGRKYAARANRHSPA
jgi:hypothetical protein